jgi:hypothetical protein
VSDATPASGEGRKPRPPRGLGAAGRALWRRLTVEFDFDARELLVLEAAARQADDVALLEALLADEGPVTVGSKGQPRLSAVVMEVRQGRLALLKLLDGLRIPGEDEEAGRSAASERASRAATSRWGRRDRQRERGATAAGAQLGVVSPGGGFGGA